MGPSYVGHPQCQFLPGLSLGTVRWWATWGPFSKALFTPLFPWCPQWDQEGRRTTKKPGQGNASLLVQELFLRESEHGTLTGTPALSYFLLRGILCPKGTSSFSFCNKRAW